MYSTACTFHIGFFSTITYFRCWAYVHEILKVPKREIFVTELFTLRDPIWIGDMRTEPIKLLV